MNVNVVLIFAIVISVLTVVNVCLFAVIKNKAMICEQYRNDCAKKSEILIKLLKEKKEKKEKKKKKKEA